MVILDEVKRRLSELAPEVTDLHDALAIERSRVRLEELEQKSASPEFYDDAAASGAVFAEMGELKDRLEQYAALQTMLEDSETLLEMCAEDDDPALAEEADAAVNSLDAKVEELRLVTLLNGEYDANNAILTFHAGAGGTEAQDWVEMLYRMYTRFAARHNWTVKVLDYLLPEGDLFRSVDYAGREEVDTSDASCVELPMAVLVNEDSYSAAEFFAAALQEYEWATIVGSQTYGKGNFQTAFYLSDGSMVNLSIGKYYTPGGKSLSETGVTPDVVVDLDDEQYALLYYNALEQADDPQFQAAIDTLTQKIS